MQPYRVAIGILSGMALLSILTNLTTENHPVVQPIVTTTDESSVESYNATRKAVAEVCHGFKQEMNSRNWYEIEYEVFEIGFERCDKILTAIARSSSDVQLSRYEAEANEIRSDLTDICSNFVGCDLDAPSNIPPKAEQSEHESSGCETAADTIAGLISFAENPDLNIDHCDTYN
ncbi:MAG: hypothetical protein ACRC8K_09425 [Waterburya sp.]